MAAKADADWIGTVLTGLGDPYLIARTIVGCFFIWRLPMFYKEFKIQKRLDAVNDVKVRSLETKLTQDIAKARQTPGASKGGMP